MNRTVLSFLVATIAISGIGASNAIAQEADLEVTLETSRANVKFGEPFLYTITVTNHGPAAATDVMFGMDSLPDAVDPRCFICESGSQSGVDNRCHLDFPLQAGGTATAILLAKIMDVSEGRRVNVTASAVGAQADPDPSNNTDSVTIGVGGKIETPSILGAPLASYGPPRQRTGGGL